MTTTVKSFAHFCCTEGDPYETSGKNQYSVRAERRVCETFLIKDARHASEPAARP